MEGEIIHTHKDRGLESNGEEERGWGRGGRDRKNR